MASQSRSQRESGRQNGLTTIHRPIHCAATSVDSYENEQDQIDIDNFLDTLAEVALAIVARKLAQSKSEQ
ncbi:MAG: hypothetical protein ACE5Q6_18790 [Dehalococcoidia bacterium]